MNDERTIKLSPEEAKEMLRKDIERMPILKEILASEESKLYVNAFIPEAREAALTRIKELPLEKRYTRRILFAL